MGLGPSKTGAFTALVPCLPMFFSTWETYHTHTLYLGYFNGPTEGLLLASLIMVISGYYGPQIWTHKVSDLLGSTAYFPFDLTIRDLWVPTLLLAFFAAHLPSCIHHVVQHRRRTHQPLLPVFLEWTPMLVYTFAAGSWLFSPHSSLLTHNRLLLFCLTMSFVFGRLTTKIILHHLTKQPFPYWTILLAPLVGGAVLGNLPRFGLDRISPTAELYYLSAYFVFALVAYVRWALLVIDTMCAYLDINCLTIKKRGDINPKKVSTPQTKGKQQRKSASANGYVDGQVKQS
ncbi:MAG: hypothetical protein Q9227_002382 [Pyrenula ochraceoflavens]